MKKLYKLTSINSSFDLDLQEEILVIELSSNIDKLEYASNPYELKSCDLFVYRMNKFILKKYKDNPYEIKEINFDNYIEGTIDIGNEIRKAYKHIDYINAKQEQKELKGLISWVNKPFGSDYFEISNKIGKLNLFYFSIDTNTIISYVSNEELLYDFIETNFCEDFYLDASRFPIKVKTQEGDKNCFYTKIKSEEIDLRFTEFKNIREQYVINCFKNEDRVFGAPEDGNYSPLTVDLAYSVIRKKIKSFYFNSSNSDKHHCDFKDFEIGSIFIRVDFFNDYPYVNCIIRSKGFTLEDVGSIVDGIYKSIPDELK